MLYLALLSLFLSKALSGPLPLDDTVAGSEASYITACEAADNCETYTDPSTDRVAVQFKKGMEPGTAEYASRFSHKNIKRDNSSHPQTQVTVSGTTINWGCGIDPVQTLGNLTNICADSGQCLSDEPYNTSITYVDPSKGSSQGSDDYSASGSLTMSATGSYPSWFHNGLIAGVQTAMGAKDIVKRDEVYYHSAPVAGPKGLPAPVDGQCTVATAPQFIGLSVYSAENGLEATISVAVNIELGSPGTGCKGLAVLGSVVGDFGEIGAALAAMFGTVAATCH